MKTDTNDISGKWKRCSKYAILNGCVVPDSSIVVEYDPWEAFTLNERKPRTVKQPYVPLLALHSELETLKAKAINPSVIGNIQRKSSGPQSEADAGILAWCNKFGLLGIVPTLTNFIRADQNKAFVRLGGSWMDGAYGTIDNGPIVDWYEWRVGRFEGRLISSIDNFHLKSLQGAHLKRDDYHQPNTMPFVETYCEPLQEIAANVGLFARAVRIMDDWSPADEGPPEEVVRHGTKAYAVRSAFNFLGALSGMVAPNFEFNLARNRLYAVRVSPGLLASYALMHLLDRSEGRRSIECDVCESMFVSGDARAKYCTPRCRNLGNVRKTRLRTSSATSAGKENGNAK